MPADPRTLYLGLISGTSADGIDAALVRFDDDDARARCELVQRRTFAWDAALRARLVELGQGGELKSLDELGTLDVRIAEAFADRYRVLAPDLRGHGDSQWAGFYPTEGYVFDLAELAERLAPFALIGHSLGGNVALRYAALFPEKVTRIVAIEGLSHSPKLVAEQRAVPIEIRLRQWIGRQREIAEKPPRRFASLAEATAHFAARHPRLDPEFAAQFAQEFRRLRQRLHRIERIEQTPLVRRSRHELRNALRAFAAAGHGTDRIGLEAALLPDHAREELQRQAGRLRRGFDHQAHRFAGASVLVG